MKKVWDTETFLCSNCCGVYTQTVQFFMDGLPQPQIQSMSRGGVSLLLPTPSHSQCTLSSMWRSGESVEVNFFNNLN